MVAILKGHVFREICTEIKEKVKHEESLPQLIGMFSKMSPLRS
jgi:hypothetical protein